MHDIGTAYDIITKIKKVCSSERNYKKHILFLLAYRGINN